MADEYILKSSVLNYLRYHSAFKSKSEIMQDIAEHESADVVQVVHSEWIYHMSYGVCKKCGYEYEWKGTDAKNYCPNCGAKMEE